jgi:hypothetical protein
MKHSEDMANSSKRCETCMAADTCPPMGGCGDLWCACPCNVAPDGDYAPLVNVDAAFGPGRCYWCGGDLEASACATCGREPARGPSFTPEQLRARVARGRSAA